MDQPQLDLETAWLKPEMILRYRMFHKDLYGRMRRLYHTLEIIKRIEAFPWDQFVDVDDQVFWGVVIENFGDCAVLLFHGLVNDESASQLSLVGFKREMGQGWLKDEFVNEYREKCRSHGVSDLIETVRRKIGTRRTHFVAHRLLRVKDVAQVPSVPGLTWPEVDALFTHTKSIFDTVSLHAECILAYQGYGEPWLERRADIDRLLDGVAARSGMVRLPELNPFVWNAQRKRKTPEFMKTMNELRLRAGLAAVD